MCYRGPGETVLPGATSKVGRSGASLETWEAQAVPNTAEQKAAGLAGQGRGGEQPTLSLCWTGREVPVPGALPAGGLFLATPQEHTLGGLGSLWVLGTQLSGQQRS